MPVSVRKTLAPRVRHSGEECDPSGYSNGISTSGNTRQRGQSEGYSGGGVGEGTLTKANTLERRGSGQFTIPCRYLHADTYLNLCRS